MSNLHLNSAEIAKHYSSFQVSDRTLLTGHSHQAWPDAAFSGHQQAWQDAASLVDNKWGIAFEKALKLKQFFATLIGDPSAENYALGTNTHELLLRFLSALDWSKGKRIITTDGEFHSMRRQLSRLQEEGIEVIRVPVSPVNTLTERMSAEVTSETTAIMMSAVMFKDSSIVPHLNIIADVANAQEIPLLVDAYHALNVVPFNLTANNLQQAFIVGGGYKYCQFGEGNCFLRIPIDCKLRPVITGWYAEFGDIEQTSNPNITQYSKGGDRFQGSTYDPTSHYRACSVIDFFAEQHYTAESLRELSQYQVGFLRDAFDALDCDTSKIARADVALQSIGGFLALKTDNAAIIQQALQVRDIWTDQRDGYLRLGPAPYLSDSQLSDAIIALGEIV